MTILQNMFYSIVGFVVENIHSTNKKITGWRTKSVDGIKLKKRTFVI